MPDMMRYIFCGILALLATLQPIDPMHLLLACAASILIAVPGLLAALLLKRNRAAWANWLAFSDMLPVALPISVFCAWPALAVFAVCHQLTGRFLGGWLLRRAGIRSEKNFTLILAYWQTLKHWHHFPQEIHPHENPLFQPARNAQNALPELLPLSGILVGLLLKAMGLHSPIRPVAATITAVLTFLLAVCPVFPHRKFSLPSLHSLPMALMRLLLLGFGVCLLGIAFPVAKRHILLICVLLPPHGLVRELRMNGVETPLCRTLEDASRWSFLLWAISGAIYLFL